MRFEPFKFSHSIDFEQWNGSYYLTWANKECKLKNIEVSLTSLKWLPFSWSRRIISRSFSLHCFFGFVVHVDNSPSIVWPLCRSILVFVEIEINPSTCNIFASISLSCLNNGKFFWRNINRSNFSWSKFVRHSDTVFRERDRTNFRS